MGTQSLSKNLLNRTPKEKEVQPPSYYQMFTRALFAWFRKNARSLPWRQTSNPYYILLSEIMLQQTQVSRVIPKYLEFIHRYPTLHHVAAASKAEIIHIWSGMGYNNRALRLRELAEILVTKNNGIIPSTPEELIKLPGIGKYTAHAVASFAFKKRVPVVDTNIDRVLKRCFPQWCKEQSVWEIARALLPQKRSHVWNQALMELGSLCCTSQSPRCNTCPWEQWCAKDIQYQQRKNSKRTEPSFRGIPNRLYRGKIVQFLRQHHKATFDDLAEFFSLSRNEYNWLQSLLQKMENDGIINIRASKNNQVITLPV